jgi:hypothetical protein
MATKASGQCSGLSLPPTSHDIAMITKCRWSTDQSGGFGPPSPHGGPAGARLRWPFRPEVRKRQRSSQLRSVTNGAFYRSEQFRSLTICYLSMTGTISLCSAGGCGWRADRLWWAVRCPRRTSGWRGPGGGGDPVFWQGQSVSSSGRCSASAYIRSTAITTSSLGVGSMPRSAARLACGRTSVAMKPNSRWFSLAPTSLPAAT